MIEAREKLGLKRESKHLVVPHGVHFERIERLPFDQINKAEIVYMGTLLEKQGIQYLIQALPLVRKEISDITFTVIGGGPYEKRLKELVRSLELDQSVRFLGYVADHKEVEKIMARAALAVSLYDPQMTTFLIMRIPAKLKIIWLRDFLC
jgi:glycosyltransferase involved in cell wall biosynthesis